MQIEKKSAAPKTKVLLSNSFSDSPEYRRMVTESLKKHGLKHFFTKDDAGKSRNPLEPIDQAIGECAAYIGLLENNYGRIPEHPELNSARLSATELEIRAAIGLNIPILLFVFNESSLLEKLSFYDQENRTKQLKLKAQVIQDSSRYPNIQIHYPESNKLSFDLVDQVVSQLARKLAGDNPKSPSKKPSNGLELSKNVTKVFDLADSYAKKFQIQSITSSCLLVAMIESATDYPDTQKWVKEYVKKYGKYEEERQRFLFEMRDEVNSPSLSEPIGKLGSALADAMKDPKENWRKIYELSEQIAKGFSSDTVIHFHATKALRAALAEAQKAPEENWYAIQLLSKAIAGNFSDKSSATTFSFRQIGELSESTQSIFDRSVSIAKQTTTYTQIHLRHLWAAFLAYICKNKYVTAGRRLRNMGVDPEEMRRDFFGYVDSLPISDDRAAWKEILLTEEKAASGESEESKPPAGPRSPFSQGTSGYNAEYCGLGGGRKAEDHLGVQSHADRLADLIALQETQLPLAIGLFGNWGSGKSHFMNLIDARLKERMKEEIARPAGATPRWCRQIVPVYFNAWHYLDSNLWASLVSQIFESLFTHLRPRKNQLAEVEKILSEVTGAAARATEEAALAEREKTKARSDLAIAEKAHELEKKAIDGMLEGLKSLVPGINLEKIQKRIVEELGVEKELKTLRDLQEAIREVKTFPDRLKKLWSQSSWRWRLGWIGGAIVIGPVLMGWFGDSMPVIKHLVKIIGNEATGLLGLIMTPIPACMPYLNKAKQALGDLEEWERKAAEAKKNKQQTQEVIDARERLKAAEAREADANRRLAEATERKSRLEEEMKNLSPERRIGRFIEQRAQSADYRGQLSLISLARRDFQELSDLFADQDALDRRLDQLRSKGEEEEAKQIKELSQSIDRIVLFVDDLDRCQPDKVVEVLQAVHLLLAFKLFAVVVGVDQRCLHQSLRIQFRGLLTADAQGAAGADPGQAQGQGQSGGTRGGGMDERPATPLDYLEKIFHVPFHLPDMQSGGFSTLIDRLTESTKPELKAGGSDDSQPKPQGAPPPIPAEPPPQTITDPPAGGAQAVTPPPPSKQAPEQNTAASPASNPAATKAEEPVVGSQPLEPWEIDALKEYHTLIRTPRGAKRLLNTYRLVRAGISSVEWESFCGVGNADGEFRLAMLLLASAAGQPASARSWFEKIKEADFKPPAQSQKPDADVAWNEWLKLHDQTIIQRNLTPSKEQWRKWIDRVERFAF